MSSDKESNTGVRFDWSADTDSVVFPTVRAVAVYVNTNDDVVIRQEAHALEREDTLVIVPRVHVPALIAALQAAVEDGED
ncbi:hypothetical protein [Stenotrophomonas sp. NLF4-10]|uniref:hypothetical protein n=1 Tax=Stenotrophomonas sp. NLF4-10 TaxID=2918754 RepID=UPI001EFB442B|nr:hypothetical protein [Stenotrophomonas sp. NLF4-10]MCG8275385.1 hypothetical protein [Stenotrophomonas sp. NLF4-10]